MRPLPVSRSPVEDVFPWSSRDPRRRARCSGSPLGARAATAARHAIQGHQSGGSGGHVGAIPAGPWLSPSRKRDVGAGLHTTLAAPVAVCTGQPPSHIDPRRGDAHCGDAHCGEGPGCGCARGDLGQRALAVSAPLEDRWLGHRCGRGSGLHRNAGDCYALDASAVTLRWHYRDSGMRAGPSLVGTPVLSHGVLVTQTTFPGPQELPALDSGQLACALRASVAQQHYRHLPRTPTGCCVACSVPGEQAVRRVRYAARRRSSPSTSACDGGPIWTLRSRALSTVGSWGQIRSRDARCAGLADHRFALASRNEGRRQFRCRAERSSTNDPDKLVCGQWASA